MHNNVKYYRRIKGLSQKQLAEMCNISQNALSDIENNLNQCHVKTALYLSIALDTTVEKLFSLQKEGSGVFTLDDFYNYIDPEDEGFLLPPS